jgi:hypothetical protein
MAGGGGGVRRREDAGKGAVCGQFTPEFLRICKCALALVELGNRGP